MQITIILSALVMFASQTFAATNPDDEPVVPIASIKGAVDLSACSPYTENPPMYALCAKQFTKVKKCQIEAEQVVFSEENIQKLREEQLQELFFGYLRGCLEKENKKDWE